MTERYERIFSYGARPVDYHLRDTWTDEVAALYKRLKERDHTALAPLLKWDIEFLTDSKAMVALINLKYSPDIPKGKAKAELRKIADEIARRPGRPRRKLPHGDQLEAELKWLTGIIEKCRLLEVKEDPHEIQDRLAVALWNPMLDTPEDAPAGFLVSGMSQKQLEELFKKGPKTVLDKETIGRRKVVHGTRREEIRILAFTLYDVICQQSRRIRKARSWALQAMSGHYGVDPKRIENSIRNEIRSGRRRR